MKVPFLRLLLTAVIFSAAAKSQVGLSMHSYVDRFQSVDKLLQTKMTLTMKRLPGASADYEIAASDVILVQVLGNANLSERLEVQRDGKIRLPMVGDIDAAGFSALELEDEIARIYMSKGLLRSPEVLVHILEYHSKPYYVLGQVDYSGEYIMSQKLTLLDAILVAGGLKGAADDYGYLHRRKAGDLTKMAVAATDLVLRDPTKPIDPDSEVTKVDLRPLKRGGVLETNPFLAEGDVFVVPARQSNQFYVIGEVTTPGAFDLPINSSLYATEAIAQAGGPLKTAKVKDGVLIRVAADGTASERAVNFERILKGEGSDFFIEKNDVVFIPGSNSKTLAYGLLGQLPATVQQSATQRMPSPGTGGNR